MNKVDYLLIEGAGTEGNDIDEVNDKSEAIFWKHLCSVYGNDLKVYPTCGVYHIAPTIEKLLTRENTGKIYIIFDWYTMVEIAEEFRPYIAWVSQDAHEKEGKEVYFARDYTFEWFLLQQKNLLDILFSWSTQQKHPEIQQFKQIQSRLLGLSNPSRWRSSLDTEFKSLLDGLGIKYGMNTTFEQLCSRLLERITRGTGFHTSKGSLGKCWYNDCVTDCYLIQQHTQLNNIPPKRYICSPIHLAESKKLTEASKLTEVFAFTDILDRFEPAWEKGALAEQELVIADRKKRLEKRQLVQTNTTQNTLQPPTTKL